MKGSFLMASTLRNEACSSECVSSQQVWTADWPVQRRWHWWSASRRSRRLGSCGWRSGAVEGRCTSAPGENHTSRIIHKNDPKQVKDFCLPCQHQCFGIAWCRTRRQAWTGWKEWRKWGGVECSRGLPQSDQRTRTAHLPSCCQQGNLPSLKRGEAVISHELVRGSANRRIPLKPRNIDMKIGSCRKGGMKDFNGLTPPSPPMSAWIFLWTLSISYRSLLFRASVNFSCNLAISGALFVMCAMFLWA